jgi:hypothetical protein
MRTNWAESGKHARRVSGEATLDQAASGLLDGLGDWSERAAEERFGGPVVEALVRADASR